MLREVLSMLLCLGASDLYFHLWQPGTSIPPYPLYAIGKGEEGGLYLEKFKMALIYLSDLLSCLFLKAHKKIAEFQNNNAEYGI